MLKMFTEQQMEDDWESESIYEIGEWDHTRNLEDMEETEIH